VLGILANVAFGVACAIADPAVGGANAYGAISNRNVFHLNAPSTPSAQDQKTADVPKLILNGFYKVGSNTRVLLAMPPKDQKDVTKYFNLAPGEQDTPVEVVKINAEKGEVEIINSGTRMTLSLARNGAKASAAPSQTVVGAPAAPSMPGGLAARTMSPGMAQAAASLALAASQASSGNSAVAVGGEESGSLSESGNGTAYGGAIVAGRNTVGGGNSGAPAESGNGSSNGGVIVAGGNSAGAIASSISYNSATAAGGSQTSVYIPPNPGSTVANLPGVNVGDALANPQNNQFRPPPRPSGPGVN
jgi:hypothetical protein